MSPYSAVQTIRLFSVSELQLKTIIEFITTHADFPVKPLKDKPFTKIKEIHIDKAHHSHYDNALEILLFQKNDHKKIFRTYVAFSSEGATFSIEKRLKSQQNDNDFNYALEKICYLVFATANAKIQISVSLALPIEKQREIFQALRGISQLFSEKNIKFTSH